MIEHRILTTENVPFTYRVAGIGSRFLAWSVDQAALLLVILPGVAIGIVLEALTQGAGFGVGLILVWAPCSRLGYFILFEWLWFGQTPGKRVMGLRAIQVQGTAMTFYHAALRNVLRMVDMLPIGYGLGMFMACTNRLSQRLGDMAAGTLVVHVEQKAAPLRLFQELGISTLPERETVWRQRLAVLTREQKQTLLDVYLRRDQLRLKERARLFAVLSQYMQTRLQLPQEGYQSDERFVQQAAMLLASDLGEVSAVRIQEPEGRSS